MYNMHACMHVYIHRHTMGTCVCTCTCLCSHACVHTCALCACMHVRVCMCMHARACVYVRVCACVYVHKSICVRLSNIDVTLCIKLQYSTNDSFLIFFYQSNKNTQNNNLHNTKSKSLNINISSTTYDFSIHRNVFHINKALYLQICKTISSLLIDKQLKFRVSWQSSRNEENNALIDKSQQLIHNNGITIVYACLCACV